MYDQLRKVRKRVRSLLDEIASRRYSRRWVESRYVLGLSTGRTGTTTVTKLFDLAPNVGSHHEPPPSILDPVQTAPYYKLETDPAGLKKNLIRYRAAVLDAHRKQGKAYVEANGLKFYAPLVAEMVPDSRFFFIHRHPVEVIRSGMRRGWYHSHPCDVSRLLPRPDDEAAKYWNSWSRVQKISWLWTATNQYLLDCVERIEPARCGIFSFSSLMDSTTMEWRRLLALADAQGVSQEDAEKILGTTFNAQTKGKEWSLEENSDEYAEIIAIAGPLMERLGYEVHPASTLAQSVSQ